MNSKRLLLVTLALVLALAAQACQSTQGRNLSPEQVRDLVTLPSGPLEDPTCTGSACVCVGAADCHTMASDYACSSSTCNNAGCVGDGCTPPAGLPTPPPPPEP